MKYKLKKGHNIGTLAAENDEMLYDAFVDTGYLESILDVQSPRFLIVGRTGSGKTALVRYLERTVERCSRIEPEELSMQYLHSNKILNMVSSLGIHLDIFFKYLWRHICILELIKLRYPDKSASTWDIVSRIFSGDSRTEKEAQDYLHIHGKEYWVAADTHVKNITQELEQKIDANAGIQSSVLSPVDFGASTSSLSREIISEEVRSRIQAVVNDYQIAALSAVVKRLQNHSFKDEKKPYYIIIDDLDKNWMPDDGMFLILVKTLLEAVRDINATMASVKIIVVLRTNIYYRVFRRSSIVEPQREKWSDVRLELRWTADELAELINNRLKTVFRGQYVQDAPSLSDILPTVKRKDVGRAYDYILNRTFMRPRDIIEYINLCIEQNNDSVGFTWKVLRSAEVVYSRNRLNSVIDEWKDSYHGIHVVLSVFKKLGELFRYSEVSDSYIDELWENPEHVHSQWLIGLQDGYLNGSISYSDIRDSILNALYIVGIVGIKRTPEDPYCYSYERPLDITEWGITDMNECKFAYHDAFNIALRLRGQGRSE